MPMRLPGGLATERGPLMLCLASSSPRRVELLSYTPWEFTTDPQDVEETAAGTPGEAVCRNALMKARSAAPKHPGDIIIGADTLVYLPARQLKLGKPRDGKDAADMLRSLSGRDHEVLTGSCVIGPDGEEQVRCDTARIWFMDMTDAMIDAYVATGEPLDKAGAYAIQGRGGQFVSRIEGSYTCVIGLSMPLLYEMLRPYEDALKPPR